MSIIKLAYDYNANGRFVAKDPQVFIDIENRTFTTPKNGFNLKKRVAKYCDRHYSQHIILPPGLTGEALESVLKRKRDDLEDSGSDDNCPICLEVLELDKPESIVVTLCCHLYHRKCLSYLIENNVSKCALCREEFVN